MADFVTTVGFDDRQVDRGIQNVDRKFNVLGANIEQRTEGVRKFTGALSSSIGVAAGVGAAIGAATGAVYGLAKAYEFVAGYQERLNEQARAYERTLASSRSIVRDFAQSGRRDRGEIDDAGARRLDARRAAEEARNAVVEKFLALNAKAVEGITLESEAAERLVELRRRLAEVNREAADPRTFDEPGRNAALEIQRQALEEQIELVAAMRNQLRAVNAEEQRRIEYINEQAKKEQAATSAREKAEREEHERRMAMEAERAAAEREREENRRRAIEREADGIRTQIELEELRARGLDEQAAALERERDLRRQIRAIEEAEGLSPAERRDLIERAKETARLEAEAAKQKRAAIEAGAGPAGAGVTGSPGAISLAAGLGGDAILTRQALGAGGSPAEQQQLATQRGIAKAVERIVQTIDDLRRTSNRGLAF
jgi:hypothetical protein